MRGVRAEVQRLAAKRQARGFTPAIPRSEKSRPVPKLAPAPTKKLRNASWWASPSNRTSRIKGRYGGGFNLILL